MHVRENAGKFKQEKKKHSKQKYIINWNILFDKWMIVEPADCYFFFRQTSKDSPKCYQNIKNFWAQFTFKIKSKDSQRLMWFMNISTWCVCFLKLVGWWNTKLWHEKQANRYVTTKFLVIQEIKEIIIPTSYPIRCNSAGNKAL